MKLQLPNHANNYIEVEGCNGQARLYVSEEHIFEVITHYLNTTQILQLINMLLGCLIQGTPHTDVLREMSEPEES